MITDNILEIASGHSDKLYNINEIYSGVSLEERLNMQKISAYSVILTEYIWRNRLFVNNNTSELFIYHEQIFLFVSDEINIDDYDKMIFEDMPDEAISHIKNIAKYKSEYWDGSGNPGEKHGEAIPLEARIYAIAKRYNELVCEASYDIRTGNSKILDVIKAEAGTRFQPELVTAFLNCYSILQKKDIELGAII